MQIELWEVQLEVRIKNVFYKIHIVKENNK